VKFADAELLGMPTMVTVGRGLANGVVEVTARASGERREVGVDDVVGALSAEGASDDPG
jgi:prolyl-tRNA synthetase